jgi:hypothetical protein
MGKSTQQEMETSSHMIGFFQLIEPIAASMLKANYLCEKSFTVNQS